ncbi:XdhC family protein [Hymenobacter sp. GOD-10R]|uniref:XdhC family protein n=1 Tax=Hymenobacter sp. GOD-10R TaxID=3093922 RepID=UPI002D79AEC9|nr:XdhC family protein [Hymenobacter sp. GOD-10R]WRQ26283.1 XdhC family protein [Hymenobacter sp. GOD-10R]
MKRALATWQLLSESLRRGVPAMLLYVVQSTGSSPGRQGFLMAVNAAGEMQGSIGGGIMEHKFVQLARERLAQPATQPSLHQQIHNKTAPKDQSGMICSGEQTILLYPARSIDAAAIEQISNALEHEQAGVLTLSSAGLGFSQRQDLGQSYVFTQEPEEAWLYQEKLGHKNSLHIIGGGHCALAFARLMRTLDFHIQLYEDRPELNTFLANDSAHGKTVVGSYSALASLVPEGENQYVVVMTFGYRTDDVALRALLSKNLKFLGVLGSQKKIEKMLGDYQAEGIPPEQLERLHAPVGLPIKSQTPEEIAISIAAQLIAVKNGL